MVRFKVMKDVRTLVLVLSVTLFFTSCASYQSAPSCGGGSFRSLNPTYHQSTYLGEEDEPNS